MTSTPVAGGTVVSLSATVSLCMAVKTYAEKSQVVSINYVILTSELAWLQLWCLNIWRNICARIASTLRRNVRRIRQSVQSQTTSMQSKATPCGCSVQHGWHFKLSRSSQKKQQHQNEDKNKDKKKKRRAPLITCAQNKCRDTNTLSNPQRANNTYVSAHSSKRKRIKGASQLLRSLTVTSSRK